MPERKSKKMRGGTPHQTKSSAEKKRLPSDKRLQDILERMTEELLTSLEENYTEKRGDYHEQ